MLIIECIVLGLNYSLSNCRSWGNWAGREDQRYSVMNMDRGQGCWNGPERSVKVCYSGLFYVRS